MTQKVTKVDVVVVGAGPAGVIAGAYLAKGGINTVVFEKTGNVGGPKWGMHQISEGFMSDNFLHLPYWDWHLNNGRGGWVKAAQELGAPIKWQCLPAAAIYPQALGRIINVPYCSCGRAVVDFFSELMPLSDESKHEMARIADQALNMPLEDIWSEKAQTTTFGDWLRERTSDDMVKSSFAMIAGIMVAMPTDVALDKCNVSYMVSTVFRFMLGGWSVFNQVVGGVQNAIPAAFGKVITEHDGRILTNHSVQRVIIEDGVAKGVIVKNDKGDEEIYEADYVVLAASYPPIRKFLGKHLPDEIHRTLEVWERDHDYVLDVHFALKRQFINPPGQTPMLIVLDEGGMLRGYISFPSNFEPSYAPPGKQQVYAEKNLTAEEHKKGKDYWVAEMMNMCEDVFPGFKDEIEAFSVHEINPFGTNYWLPAKKVPLECPGVARLYFAGDYVKGEGNGTELAASTGTIVARRILVRENKAVC